jgi:hypothetical protein
MDGKSRLFDPVADNNLRVATSGEPEPAPTACPPTPAACVAFASCDVAAVEAAEQAALRLFDATALWRLPSDPQMVTRPSRCVWELLPIGGVVRARRIQMVQGRAVVALEAACLAVEEHDRALFEETSTAIEQADLRIAALVEERPGLRIKDASRVRWWTLARELDVAVPKELRRDHGLGRMPKALRGKRFNELPDFAPDLATVVLAGFAAGIHGATCNMFAVRPAWAILAAPS